MSTLDLAARPHDIAVLTGARRWWALGAMLAGMFMAILDVFITNVAVPSIRAELGANYAEIQLVIAGYGLAYGIALVTGGRLGDIHGRKRLYLAGMAGFVVTSVLCGIAPTPAALIVARVLQGIAAAAMFPQIFAMIRVGFAPSDQARAFAIMGAVMGVAAIAGQLIGGLLLAFDPVGLGWRAVFLINLPFGIVALIAAQLTLVESRVPGAATLDLVGVVLATAALTLLLVPLMLGREHGWPWWSIACLIASLPAAALFVVQQREISGSDRTPLMLLTLFGDRAFSVGLAVVLVFYTTLTSFFLVMTLLLQVGLARDALHAAYVFVPGATAFLFTSIATPRLLRRYGRSVLSVGTAIAVAGYLAAAAIAWTGHVGAGGFSLVPAMTVTAFGQGLVMTPLLGVILGSIRGAHAGSASGVLSTTQQVGGALGIAVVGIVFFGILDAGPAGIATHERAFAAACLYDAAAMAVVLALLRLLPGAPAR